MAINRSRLFTALGRLTAALNETNTDRGATLTAREGVLRTQLQGVAPGLDDTLSSSRASAVAAADGWVGYLRTAASRVLLAEYLNDRPAAATDTTSIWRELRRQMVDAGEDIDDFLCSVAVTAGATPGANGLLWATSLADAVGGLPTNFAVPDSIIAEVQVPGAVQLTGLSATDLAASGWPSGAGVSTTLTPVDAHRVSFGAITNGNFVNWSSTTALSAPWATTGTYTQNADTPSGVGFSVQVPAGPDVVLSQPLPLPGSSLACLHFAARFIAPGDPSPEDLIIEAALLDTTGAVVASYIVLGTGAPSNATDSWVSIARFLHVPSDAATLRLTVSNTTGTAARLAAVQVATPQPLYPAGLYVQPWAVAGGAVSVGRSWTIATTTAQTATTRLIAGVYRLLPELASLPFRLPVDASSPTYSGSLIV